MANATGRRHSPSLSTTQLARRGKIAAEARLESRKNPTSPPFFSLHRNVIYSVIYRRVQSLLSLLIIESSYDEI